MVGSQVRESRSFQLKSNSALIRCGRRLSPLSWDSKICKKCVKLGIKNNQVAKSVILIFWYSQIKFVKECKFNFANSMYT